MAISWIQPSFAGGEIGPSLYGRIDMAKYQVALRKCDNFIVRQYGGVENRPGTRFVGAAKYPNRKCRLIPFQFSTVQTYALEFGHLYMRVIKDGALVLNSSNVIYEIATPYTEADLFRIKFTQSADVLTLVHLEGQTVNILSDANVEPQKVVSGGAVTLESPGAVVHIGLPITAEFETLDININGQETLLDKKQVIPSVTLVVNASRGIWATTPGGKWYEYPQREFEFYDDPVDDATGKVEVKLDSNWGKNGRVRIRQLDPLPLSVLAVIPRLTVGGF
ncbi:TPA: hypothetical protein ACNTAD_001534 [Escherichia coli]